MAKANNYKVIFHSPFFLNGPRLQLLHGHSKIQQTGLEAYIQQNTTKKKQKRRPAV